MRSYWLPGVTALSLVAVGVAHTRSAAACGGCFLPQATTETSVVTAHRMAFAISTTRSVLWDQIQYSGDPADFSWVLPVRGNAQLEAAEDAWFEALDAVTSTRVSPPQLNCLTRNGPRGSGCSCGGMSSDELSGGGPDNTFPNGVTITHQGTVGPYAYVQLKASSTSSLTNWLPANGYAVPPSVVSVIDAYVQEQFDFLALKLRPGFGTRQMTPVRVVTEGASASLPLRMVAAGTGPFVGITLFVLSESRFEVTGFGSAAIDPAQLTYDWAARTSNYAELRASALSAGNGRNWLTTFAARGALFRSWTDALGQTISLSASTSIAGVRTQQGAQSLAELYFAQASLNSGKPSSCAAVSSVLTSRAKVVDSCTVVPPADAGGLDGAVAAREGGTDASTLADASAVDGSSAVGNDASDATVLDGPSASGNDSAKPVGNDARSEVGSANPMRMAEGVIPKPQRVCAGVGAGEIAASTLECGGFTDVAAATIGMHLADVWITRLEANLPHDSLTEDLALRSAPAQDEVVSALRATRHVNPPCELVEDHPFEAALESRSPARAPVAHASFGFLSALGVLVARRMTKKRA